MRTSTAPLFSREDSSSRIGPTVRAPAALDTRRLLAGPGSGSFRSSATTAASEGSLDSLTQDLLHPAVVDRGRATLATLSTPLSFSPPTEQAHSRQLSLSNPSLPLNSLIEGHVAVSSATPARSSVWSAAAASSSAKKSRSVDERSSEGDRFVEPLVGQTRGTSDRSTCVASASRWLAAARAASIRDSIQDPIKFSSVHEIADVMTPSVHADARIGSADLGSTSKHAAVSTNRAGMNGGSLFGINTVSQRSRFSSDTELPLPTTPRVASSRPHYQPAHVASSHIIPEAHQPLTKSVERRETSYVGPSQSVISVNESVSRDASVPTGASWLVRAPKAQAKFVVPQSPQLVTHPPADKATSSAVLSTSNESHSLRPSTREPELQRRSSVSTVFSPQISHPLWTLDNETPSRVINTMTQSSRHAVRRDKSPHSLSADTCAPLPVTAAALVSQGNHESTGSMPVAFSRQLNRVPSPTPPDLRGATSSVFPPPQEKCPIEPLQLSNPSRNEFLVDIHPVVSALQQQQQQRSVSQVASGDHNAVTGAPSLLNHLIDSILLTNELIHGSVKSSHLGNTSHEEVVHKIQPDAPSSKQLGTVMPISAVTAGPVDVSDLTNRSSASHLLGRTNSLLLAESKQSGLGEILLHPRSPTPSRESMPLASLPVFSPARSRSLSRFGQLRAASGSRVQLLESEGGHTSVATTRAEASQMLELARRLTALIESDKAAGQLKQPRTRFARSSSPPVPQAKHPPASSEIQETTASSAQLAARLEDLLSSVAERMSDADLTELVLATIAAEDKIDRGSADTPQRRADPVHTQRRETAQSRVAKFELARPTEYAEPANSNLHRQTKGRPKSQQRPAWDDGSAASAAASTRRTPRRDVPVHVGLKPPVPRANSATPRSRRDATSGHLLSPTSTSAADCTPVLSQLRGILVGHSEVDGVADTRTGRSRHSPESLVAAARLLADAIASTVSTTSGSNGHDSELPLLNSAQATSIPSTATSTSAAQTGPHLQWADEDGHTPLLESFKAVSRLMARVSDLGRHLVRGTGKASVPKAASAASREPAAPIPSLRDWAAIHSPPRFRRPAPSTDDRQQCSTMPASPIRQPRIVHVAPATPLSNPRSAFATSRSPTRGPSTSPVTRASQHEATATAEVVAPVAISSESRSDVLPGVASNAAASRELSTPPRSPPAADEYFGGREDGRRMQLTPVQTSKSTAVPSPKWQAEVDMPVEAAHSPLALGTGRAEADTGAQEHALLQQASTIAEQARSGSSAPLVVPATSSNALQEDLVPAAPSAIAASELVFDDDE